MSEVSHAWLDRVVTARQRLEEVGVALSHLKTLINRGDIDCHNYSSTAEDILQADGTAHRHNAMRERQLLIAEHLHQAVRHGDSVGSVLMALTELLDAANETLLNTDALLADITPEDPFIDRLEEHPAYERD